MAEVTFQVLEGLEAGRLYERLSTPLTIGREEDNDIQLNDERISRFHAKIQCDAGRIILTDLDSTNGTRVNGHPVRLRALQPGDLVTIGRCVLLLGRPDELPPHHPAAPGDDAGAGDEAPAAFPNGAPRSPTQLTALQRVELGDLLDYIRHEVLAVLRTPVDELQLDGPPSLRVSAAAWRRLESLGAELSRTVAEITSPDEQ